MQKDENQDSRPSPVPGPPSDSNHDTFFGAFPPSAELRHKLNKLAKWRLDLSSIEFVDGAAEFHGGYATVSRAFLVSPFSGQDRASQSNPTKKDGIDVPRPAGEASRQWKDVAVKKMKISDDTAPERTLGLTLREAEFLAGLSHVNVIKLEGFVEDLSKDVVWLVFPWAENGNLKNFIAAAEWELPERISLIRDVAGGVEYLHNQQPPIRHGDLKSINILVNSNYRAVITDFGSARRQTTEDLDNEASQAGNQPQPALSLEVTSCGSTNTMRITLTGDNFTLRWAAPELLNEEKATLASDIWAVGCVVYEVMTNSTPFQDVVGGAAVIVRVVQGDLPSISDNARMLLIQALCSLVLACWSVDPRKRPTASNFRKAISWMPMIKPNPIRAPEAAASRARSPALLMKLSDMYRRQYDYIKASDFLTRALGRYREIGDSKGKAAALGELGQVHRLRNEYSQAITFYNEALQILTDIGDRQGRAYVLQGIAHLHRLRNEYSQAITFYSEALQIRTDIGDRQGRADSLFGLGEVHRVQNQYSQAVASYTEALQIRTDIDDRLGKANALSGLADVHRHRNEYSQAIPFYSKALDIRTDIGDRFGRAYALQGLADVHRARPDGPFYSDALQVRTDPGDGHRRANALSGLAEVHRARREYTQAIPLYSEALEIRTDIGDRYGRAITLRSLARVHQSQSKYSQAITLFSDALQICTDIADRSGRAYCLLGVAGVHRDQGDYQDASALYTEAAEIFQRIGHIEDATYASNQAAKFRRPSNREEAT